MASQQGFNAPKKGQQGFQRGTSGMSAPTSAPHIPVPVPIKKIGSNGDDSTMYVTLKGSDYKLSGNPFKRAGQVKSRNKSIDAACSWFLAGGPGDANSAVAKNLENTAKYSSAGEMASSWYAACSQVGVDPLSDFNSWSDEQKAAVSNGIVKSHYQIAGSPNFG